jgi:hypothetical protein
MSVVHHRLLDQRGGRVGVLSVIGAVARAGDLLGISQSKPIAKLSACPCANLLTLLKVSGQASTASADGAAFPVPGILYSERTGSPVSRSSSAGSMNLVPSGVEKTATRHPAAWHIVTS